MSDGKTHSYGDGCEGGHGEAAVIALLGARCAQLVEALEQVRETAENSRRAESKGSGPYTVAFFLACLDKLDDALTPGTEAAFVERIRAEERQRAAAIARNQPFYPDTHTGMRQQWVKEQIARAILEIPGKDGET